MEETNFNISNSNINSITRTINGNYSNSFHCSNDQLYTPIYVQKNPTSKPGLEKPTGEHIGPTSDTLNPYFSLGVNMDYNTVCHDDDAKNLSPIKKQYKDIQEFRTMGFRGPMLMSGYGFDICDQPVPNDGDGGFDKGVAKNRKLYKSGPVDLKWDDERKVWSGGLHIVEGLLISDITAPISARSPTTFNISVSRGKDWQDMGEIIECYNRDKSLSVVLNGREIYISVMRINYEWRPFYIGCGDING
jgi:hypothetical protein